MDNWATAINNIIDEKLKDSREKDLRFLRIAEFKRNIARTGEFAKNCPDCNRQKKSISEIADKIDEVVELPGKPRRNYDRLISQLSKHIQKEHGFYAPYYFSYIYSTIGIITGLLIGFGLTKIFSGFYIEMLSVGFVTGLMPSYVLGYIKDKKIRAEKRIM